MFLFSLFCCHKNKSEGQKSYQKHSALFNLPLQAPCKSQNFSRYTHVRHSLCNRRVQPSCSMLLLCLSNLYKFAPCILQRITESQNTRWAKAAEIASPASCQEHSLVKEAVQQSSGMSLLLFQPIQAFLQGVSPSGSVYLPAQFGDTLGKHFVFQAAFPAPDLSP